MTTVAPANITLSASVRKVKSKTHVDLAWSGATTAEVEIHRNDSLLVTTVNDGAHTDSLGARKGTFRYRVSHPGGSPVSNEVVVTV